MQVSGLVTRALLAGLLATAGASAQVSRPQVQPQPSVASYGWQVLSLFKHYTRDSYFKEFGVQAPGYNPARRIKTWFDSTVDTSDPESLVSYRILAQDRSGTWGFRTVSMTAAEAASVNLPGRTAYPPYVVTPSRATRGGSPVNAEYLSLREQAEEIARGLGRGVVIDEGQTAVYPVEYPAGEPRRMWAIALAGLNHNVGLLLKMRHANGVGAPGRWELRGDEPVWAAAPPPPDGLDDTRPHREMPVRDLLPNERLQTGMFGVSIARTDLGADGEASGFSAADRQMLREILELLRSRR